MNCSSCFGSGWSPFHINIIPCLFGQKFSHFPHFIHPIRFGYVCLVSWSFLDWLVLTYDDDSSESVTAAGWLVAPSFSAVVCRAVGGSVYIILLYPLSGHLVRLFRLAIRRGLYTPLYSWATEWVSEWMACVFDNILVIRERLKMGLDIHSTHLDFSCRH